jgi:hypothetical protein
VRLCSFAARWAYASVDEAVAENRDRLLVAPGTPADARLHAALAERLVRGDDGLWHWPTPPTQLAILTWGPGTGTQAAGDD